MPATGVNRLAFFRRASRTGFGRCHPAHLNLPHAPRPPPRFGPPPFPGGRCPAAWLARCSAPWRAVGPRAPAALRGGSMPPFSPASLSLSGRCESGRRDSNPRPSPWQGGGFGLGDLLPTGEVLFRPPSFQPVHRIRPCSRAVCCPPEITAKPQVVRFGPRAHTNLGGNPFGVYRSQPWRHPVYMVRGLDCGRLTRRDRGRAGAGCCVRGRGSRRLPRWTSTEVVKRASQFRSGRCGPQRREGSQGSGDPRRHDSGCASFRRFDPPARRCLRSRS